jgi:hypothetical protein
MEATVIYPGPAKSESRCNSSEIIFKSGKPVLHTDGQFRPLKAIVHALFLLTALALTVSPSLAQGSDDNTFSYWTKGWDFKQSYLYSSFYTRHYDPDPDHVNDQNMLGFEGQTRDKRVMGMAVFDNSFGQESQYLYVGKKWRAFRSDQWYYKLTGGLLNGYDEPYDDKIPLNDLGVAPAIVPTLGYRGKTFAIEFSQLGLAAGMITAGYTF